MIDRIFSAALTFCLLTAGTLAAGSVLFGIDRPAASSYIKVVQLQPVVVTGKRLPQAAKVASAHIADSAAPRLQ